VTEAIDAALSQSAPETDFYEGPKHIWSRQVADQISVGRLYVAIARESTNYHLALEFSNQVKACQNLLEAAKKSGRPVKKWEAQAAVEEMSKLTWQARALRYDPATVLMKLKAQMQVRPWTVSLVLSLFVLPPLLLCSIALLLSS
jgi:hypothetical protein